METFVPRGSIYGPILPLFVLERPISLGAKIMYALLCNYASEKDHCWPSQATLAARLSCSVSSAKNYLGELVKAKLIAIRREQYRSSVYYLLNPGELRGQEVKNDGPQPENACPEPESGYLNNLNKQSQEKNPPLPPTEPEAPKVSPGSEPPAAGGVSVSSSDFESAWALYPKKDAKGFARVAWLKLQRSGQLPPLDQIRAAIQRFAASESWQREEGRFVPQMGNWLRGQRWLDPLSPAEEAAERERQRREELSRSLRVQEEQEKRLQGQRNAEKARLRPLFDAFAAKFTEPFNDAMAFGTWMYLHSKGLAPMASDVPPGNVLGAVDFMNTFKRKCEEAQYRARHGQPEVKRLDVRVNEPRSCGELLRHNPILSQLFQELNNCGRPSKASCTEATMRNNRGSIVKRLCLCCLWAAMAVLLVVGSSWADDAQKQPPPPPAAVDTQGAAVLGQPEAQPSPASGTMVQRQEARPLREQQPGAANPDTGKTREAQALFEESLRQMMPLNEGQIQEYRERSDQRDRALLPVSPSLNSRTVRVSLEPGRAPVKVFTTANIATSLVFHDSTGQPWPITSVTNGGPNYFQVLRPELPDGNLLNVMPVQGYGTSTIVVTLEKKDIPLVIRLESDSVRSPERKADALVLFQLAHYGPKASIPIIENIKETADSAMLAFLDRVPPDDAARVRMEPAQEKVNVWLHNGKHYIRTSHSLMWPAWTAVVNGAGNVKCYEAPVTGRVMLSVNGRIQTVILKDSLK